MNAPESLGDIKPENFEKMNAPESLDDIKPEKFEIMFAQRENFQNYVLKNGQQGDIKNIIDTIDKFARTESWLMNVGDQKGEILDQAIQSRKPKTVLELGTFLGYSALRIIAQLPKDSLFISIEYDAKSSGIAHSILQHVGVDDRVKIITDDSEKAIPLLSKDFNIDSFDLIFIDHYKEFYLRDFKMLENLGLIKSGTMIVADNVIWPGAPDYLEYVRNNPNYTTIFHEATVEYQDRIRDGVEISTRK